MLTALKDQLDFQLYIIIDTSFINRRTDILQAIITDPELTLFTTLHGIVRTIDRFTLSAVLPVIINRRCLLSYLPA